MLDLVDRTAAYFRHHFGHAPKIRAINHQLAHLASAFFQSGFDKATCISYDAYGDKLSAALAVADRRSGIRIEETRPFDNSLGHFYGTVTSFLGFYPGEDEYKVMGLAPYGEPRYVDQMKEIVRLNTDGRFGAVNFIAHCPRELVTAVAFWTFCHFPSTKSWRCTVMPRCAGLSVPLSLYCSPTNTLSAEGLDTSLNGGSLPIASAGMAEMASAAAMTATAAKRKRRYTAYLRGLSRNYR